MILFVLFGILSISFAQENVKEEFDFLAFGPDVDPNLVSFEIVACENLGEQQVEEALENDSFFHGRVFFNEIGEHKFLVGVNDGDDKIDPLETLATRLQEHLAVTFSGCDFEVKNVRHIFSELLPEPNSLETDIMTLDETSIAIGRRSLSIEELPESHELQHLIPGGVRSQGRFPTCVAFAVATMKSYQEHVELGLNEPMSPRFIHAYQNTLGRGWNFAAATDVLRTYGSIEESRMPYSQMQEKQDASTISDDIKADALKHTVTSTQWGEVRTHNMRYDLEGFKNVIKMGLYYHGVGIMSTAVFKNRNMCQMWKPEGEFAGYHAMTVTGYRKDGIIIQNSWGKGYCSRGYTFIKWEDAVKHIQSYMFTQDTISTPHWVTSGFSDCNVSCGNGVQKQTVYCRQGSSVIDDSLCPGVKPLTQKDCQTGVVCPSSVQYWSMNFGDSKCPKGEEITTFEECKTAILSMPNAFGSSHQQVSYWGIPTFCTKHVHGSGKNQVYFNTASGVAHENYAPICKRTVKTQYYALDFGARECPNGEEIKTSAECQSAILSMPNALGNSHQNINYYLVPKYCAKHLSRGKNQVYFNSADVGNPSPDYAPICKRVVIEQYYTAGGFGEAKCPPGHEITSFAECKDAVMSLPNALGSSHQQVSYWGIPSFCTKHVHGSGKNQVYFNTASGTAHPNYAPICKVKGLSRRLLRL